LLSWSRMYGSGRQCHSMTCNGSLRLPTVEPSFITYDLGAQAAVQAALLANGIPAEKPIAFEPNELWLGTPFFWVGTTSL